MAILGVDVGGTFTDAVLVADGSVTNAKVPTAARQEESVLAAARAVGADRVDRFAHGTTAATNALLERKGIPGHVLPAEAAVGPYNELADAAGRPCGPFDPPHTGSRRSGHVMQWPPPRPLPSSNPAISITSTPASRILAIV